MRATGMPDWIVAIVASHRRLDARERADRRGNRLRDAGELQRQSVMMPSVPSADEQPRQVVAGGGFARPRAVRITAVGEHDAQASTLSRMVP
jgi:hypothetical protein